MESSHCHFSVSLIELNLFMIQINSEKSGLSSIHVGLFDGILGQFRQTIGQQSINKIDASNKRKPQAQIRQS